MKLTLLFFLTLTLAACSSSNKKMAPAKKAKTKQEAVKTMKPDHSKAKPATPAPKPHHSKWSYSGLTGPEMWGDLETTYKTCKSGHLQSPIDLVWSRPAKNGDIKFNYINSNYSLVDNGHTVLANFKPGNSIKIRGNEYELTQFHFHAHSEHTISGKKFPLEAHFVHQNKKGELAVIAVLFVEGKTNPFLEAVWQQFPKEKNRQVASTSTFNPQNLLPQALTYYHYEGSLTTPPCSEGVNWNVFNTPIEVSKAQIDQFKLLYKNNFRPLQKTNNRKVTNY